MTFGRVGCLLLLCAATDGAERCVAIKRGTGAQNGSGRKSDQGIALCEQDKSRQQSEQACKAGDIVPGKDRNLDPATECKWETEDCEGCMVGYILFAFGVLAAVGIGMQWRAWRLKQRDMVTDSTSLGDGSPPTQVAQAVEVTEVTEGVPVLVAQGQVVGGATTVSTRQYDPTGNGST